MMISDYQIVDDHLGVRDFKKYVINNSEKNFDRCKKLQADFMRVFERFSSVEDADYAFPEWHRGTMVISVYPHSERFYGSFFVS
jgi:hypothetical protein